MLLLLNSNHRHRKGLVTDASGHNVTHVRYTHPLARLVREFVGVPLRAERPAEEVAQDRRAADREESSYLDEYIALLAATDAQLPEFWCPLARCNQPECVVGVMGSSALDLFEQTIG